MCVLSKGWIAFALFFLAAPVCARTGHAAETAQQQTEKTHIDTGIAPKESDFVARNFRFRSGETLPKLRLHYITLGTPRPDQNGEVTNAVLILHGTGGSGRAFLSPQFRGVLFGSGQLLDANRYFIILPDAIGHGRSSKPSDGLRTRFPKYDYDDMVAAQHQLVAEGLGVHHLRLIIGTSMGCMHSWVWAETYPEFMDALVPLACLPVEIAGRNRLWRKAMIDAIRTDPEWKNGQYTSQPPSLRTANSLLLLLIDNPVLMQANLPTRAAADQFLEERVKARLRATDANDMLYQFDASRNYDPSPALAQIKARVLAINFADDLINPPELGIAEREIQKVKNGRFVLFQRSEQTRGHGTHSLPAVWKNELAALLDSLERER